MFLGWQVVENQLIDTQLGLHRVHIARGVSTSVVTAGVVGWLVFRRRRRG